MSRTIRITATATHQAAPDTYELSMTLNAKAPAYAETLQKAEDKLRALQAAVREAGFDPATLLTGSFQIDPEYQHVREDGDYQMVLTGYSCRQTLTLTLPPVNERLTALMDTLKCCSAEPEFSVNFAVSESREAAQAKALTLAVQKAQREAATLAAAAGVTLGDICSIVHENHGDAPVCFAAARGLDSMTPQEITVSATVTIEWSI